MQIELPENATIVGSVIVVQYLDSEGEFKTAYDSEGVSDEAAIGFLTTVCDRLRAEASYRWETCPDCNRPWSEHEGMEDDEE